MLISYFPSDEICWNVGNRAKRYLWNAACIYALYHLSFWVITRVPSRLPQKPRIPSIRRLRFTEPRSLFPSFNSVTSIKAASTGYSLPTMTDPSSLRVTRIACFRFRQSVTAEQKGDRTRAFLNLYAQHKELLEGMPKGGKPLNTPLNLTNVKRDSVWDTGFVVTFKVRRFDTNVHSTSDVYVQEAKV